MKKYITLWFCALALTSCNVLEQEPKSMVTEANAWKSENDVIAEIHGAYALIRSAMVGDSKTYAYWAYGDLRFGDIVYNNLNNNLDKLNLKSDTYNIEPLTQWKKFYSAIVQCNLIIENAPRIPKSEFNQYSLEHYLGEAHFLRGFLYFYISRIWGDVPLQTKALNKDPLPREKTDVVLDFAIKDTQFAIRNLPWQYPYDAARVKAIRATRGAAYTLMSHIHMWQKKDSEALEASKAVIDSLSLSGYDLLPMTASAESDKIFKGRSAEGIFEIDFSDADKEVGNQTIANMALCWPPYATNTYWETTSVSASLLQLYSDPNDRRRSLWFNTTNSSPMLIKFKNTAASLKNAYEDNILIFRLAELYLLRAEGLANTGDRNGAIALLDKVRQRAGAAAYSETEGDLKLAIVQERRKELVGEGHVWFDMLRNGYLLHFKGATYTEQDLQMGAWAWPIHKYAFTTNPLLTQTPFWI